MIPGQAAAAHTHATRLRSYSPLPAWPLYLAFVATGVGVALPGAILPALLLRGHLTDAQGGRLFLFAWIGSSLGALAVRGALRNSLLAGCTSFILGACGLAFTSQSVSYALLSMALFGAGLGLVMTSTTLLREDAAHHPGAELIRLNFAWALGAALSPTLAERALRVGDPRPVLLSLAALFALLGIWLATRPGTRPPLTRPPARRTWRALTTVPPTLLAAIMLTTGIEASLGGWLATYSRRGGAGLTEVIAAPSCLWAGLLLSRLLWTRMSHASCALAILRGSVTLMAAAGTLLIARSTGPTLPLAAFFLGCGLGPVYPLLLAGVLRFSGTGDIFFLAGVGSACLPWLTGVAAAAQGSLRAGLFVPLAGTFAILAILSTSPHKAGSAASALGELSRPPA